MPAWVTIAVAFLGGLATVLYDLWSRKQGDKAKIENVGLQQKAHEELQSQIVEDEIRRKQEDAKKENLVQAGKQTFQDWDSKE